MNVVLNTVYGYFFVDPPLPHSKNIEFLVRIDDNTSSSPTVIGRSLPPYLRLQLDGALSSNCSCREFELDFDNIPDILVL